MDSFIKIAQKINVKDITIKDITNEATVNSATFYAHFTDKYNLLDAVITENILENVIEKLHRHDTFNDKSIQEIFLALTTFQTDLKSQCSKSFESFSITIEKKIKNELEKLFLSLLIKQQSTPEVESLKVGAVMLSWGIYGASIDWQENSSLSAKEYIKIAIPYIMKGIGEYKS
ncbi:TetR/AcrR family transcriptional regulator [Psychrobacillus vulpis]|uniref:TetR/AcrR family transcriptional regulator n=1 Tax=Psychrobacillus vulpis TaxID=2325572 RepID=UPI001F0EE3F6|nr:TetR/AcrR family transcriptional regulator [Psychrobacillus vulpis]